MKDLLKVRGSLEIPTDKKIRKGKKYIKEVFKAVKRLEIEKIYGCPKDFTWLMDVFYERLCYKKYTILDLFECSIKNNKLDMIQTIYKVNSSKINEFSTIYGYKFNQDCKISIKTTKNPINFSKAMNNSKKIIKPNRINRFNKEFKDKYYKNIQNLPDFSNYYRKDKNKFQMKLLLIGIGFLI